MKVVIMCGIPGSGKTKWIAEAKKPLGTLAGKHVLVVSTDNFFRGEDGSYAFDPSKLGEAHGSCLLMYEDALRREACDVLVVDNTNTTTEEIAPYMALALARDARVEIMHVWCDPKIAYERGTHGVPLYACEAMHQRHCDMRFPSFWRHDARVSIFSNQREES